MVIIMWPRTRPFEGQFVLPRLIILCIGNQCTKSEVFSFSCSRYFRGTWPRPFQGWFVVHRLGLNMINLCTKSAVSKFTHYEGTKGNAKYRNGWSGETGGHPRSLGNTTIRQIAYDILFDFNRKYVSILYCFSVIISYLTKITNFNLPHLHLAPSLRVTLLEFRQYLWHQNTRFPGL